MTLPNLHLYVTACPLCRHIDPDTFSSDPVKAVELAGAHDKKHQHPNNTAMLFEVQRYDGDTRMDVLELHDGPSMKTVSRFGIDVCSGKWFGEGGTKINWPGCGARDVEYAKRFVALLDMAITYGATLDNV